MPKHPQKTMSGVITHIFAHRFVLRTEDGDMLADMTPKGSEQIALNLNDKVTVEGEMKPSELKVEILTRGSDKVLVEHGKKPHDEPSDPAVALATARAAGFAVLGSRRKPKHFEVLGKKSGDLVELHIELDGHIRKSKSVAKDDHKWTAILRDAI